MTVPTDGITFNSIYLICFEMCMFLSLLVNDIFFGVSCPLKRFKSSIHLKQWFCCLNNIVITAWVLWLCSSFWILNDNLTQNRTHSHTETIWNITIDIDDFRHYWVHWLFLTYSYNLRLPLLYESSNDEMKLVIFRSCHVVSIFLLVHCFEEL